MFTEFSANGRGKSVDVYGIFRDGTGKIRQSLRNYPRLDGKNPSMFTEFFAIGRKEAIVKMKKKINNFVHSIGVTKNYVRSC